MKYILSSFLLVLFAPGLLAFGTKGGGNVLVCFDNHPEILKKYYQRIAEARILAAKTGESGPEFLSGVMSVSIDEEDLDKVTRMTSFDLAEAEDAIRGNPNKTIRPALDGETPDEYVERLIVDIFDGFEDSIAERMRLYASEIPFRDSISKMHGVVPQFDFTSVGLVDRARCVLSNLFVQETLNAEVSKEGKLIGGKHFLYRDDRLWNHEKLSNLSKLVTYLHEVIYLISRVDGQKTSDITRKVTGLLITQSSELSYHRLVSELQALGFSKRSPEGSAAAIVKGFALDYERKFSNLLLAHTRSLVNSMMEDFTNMGLLIRRSYQDIEPTYIPLRESLWYEELEKRLAAGDVFGVKEYMSDFERNGGMGIRIRTLTRKSMKAPEDESFVVPNAEIQERIETWILKFCDLRGLMASVYESGKQIFETEIVPRIEASPLLSNDDRSNAIAYLRSRLQPSRPYMELWFRAGGRYLLIGRPQRVQESVSKFDTYFDNEFSGIEDRQTLNLKFDVRVYPLVK